VLFVIMRQVQNKILIVRYSVSGGEDRFLVRLVSWLGITIFEGGDAMRDILRRLFCCVRIEEVCHHFLGSHKIIRRGISLFYLTNVRGLKR